jgi:hypothetical protein
VISQLCNAIQLAFLDYPLVRFAGIFNPILAVIAFGWQELRDPINVVRAAATEGSGHKAHRLTDFEFMLRHGALHHDERQWRGTLSVEPGTSITCFMELLLTQIAAWGDFNGFYFVVKRLPHGLPITRWVPLTT